MIVIGISLGFTIAFRYHDAIEQLGEKTAALVTVKGRAISLEAEVDRNSADKRLAAEVNQLCNLGLMFRQEGEWSFAEREYKKALELDSDHVDTLMALALTKKEIFNRIPSKRDDRLLEDANDLCVHARELEPDSIPVLNLHGVILKKLRRYDEAVATWGKVASMAVPSDPKERLHYDAAFSNVGMAHALAGDLEAAEINLRKGADSMALQHGPHSAAAWRNFAALGQFQGQPACLDHVRKAIQAGPADVAGWVLRARIRLTIDGLQAFEDALDDAKHAERLAASSRADAKRVLAMAYLRNDQFDRTIEEARHAIDLGDILAINKLLIAIAEARRDNFDAARANLSDALRAWPERLTDEHDWYATAPAGQLWFESGAELYALKAEAEDAINSGAAP